ncbi:FAD/NAD(P)-binding protein [Glycomyces algeriensis]|uniref:FAD-dependent urate hydroxylase HpyO/Asp monooxygenase CreE-like FAD/NAD(P)-binding domain-containing protein n=1 Tax=Glycomyces algeriensis TaxID=256037 RepID=A0A9W6LHV5_9ACTN|nr:FAD/NAD(P)-binding protein [Glycomyces algeriensis]MDA1364313.1 FAD/NAD(P)-binding protein [Glycomyces algeriensis]MDR7350345.1 putative NAD(P)/FAD-binding protein YdhS [Glycomyces algeriensis]GLI43051.1 hypothetical protein GALLR39Z86_29010 [Glycomyces algeriensis]
MDIAIIGAGAAAVGVLDALAADPRGRGSITVFEPSPHRWRGRPYGPDLDAVLVNAPPAIMSIRHGDFGHFASWLGGAGAAHLDALLERPLVPRALYGRYLEDTAEAATATLRERGREVRIVAERVTGVARTAARLSVTAETGAGAVVDQVVLCVGGGVPDDHYGLAGTRGFIADPYPMERTLGEIPPGSTVAVIGSGLTAVDVVVSLAANGHRGRITLLSRTGMLPHVWQRPVDRRPQHLTAGAVAALEREDGTVALDDLVALLRAELDTAGEDFAGFAADLLAAESEDQAERLRAQLGSVADPAIGRRFLQEAAHMLGPFAWRRLPEPDRDRLRRLRRLITGVASPMVPVNAAILLQLFESGQLGIVSGLRGVKPVDGGFHAYGDAGESVADVVVNAVNPLPQAVPRGAASLIESLIAEELAAPHPSGGLDPADPRVHVVGDLAGGGPFITSSIPGIAAQAASAVGAMLTGPSDRNPIGMPVAP